MLSDLVVGKRLLPPIDHWLKEAQKHLGNNDLPSASFYIFNLGFEPDERSKIFRKNIIQKCFDLELKESSRASFELSLTKSLLSDFLFQRQFDFISTPTL